MTNTSENKIEALQALRGIAFIGIFLTHAGAKICWPNLGVSIFFVLSGFLMMYIYGSKEIETGFISNIKYSYNKIKKIYPLHIITLCFAFVLELAILIHQGISVSSLGALLGKVLLNIFLVQSWFPDFQVNISLNGVAWYLSVMAFLYFCFPWIKRWICSKKNYFLYGMCIIILLLQIGLCIPFINKVGSANMTYLWFSYCFPVFRLGDFFAGCVLGKVFDKKHGSKNVAVNSVFEILAFIFTLAILLWMNYPQNTSLLLALQNLTSINIVLAVIWVYLFVRCEGIITKALSNPLLVKLGNISANAFLIHYIVTRYFECGLAFLKVTQMSEPIKIGLIIIEFIITVYISKKQK